MINDLRNAAEIIEMSGMFNRDWYTELYGGHIQDEAPIEHYLKAGANLDFFPNPFFDTKWYRERECLEYSLNPLLHFIKSGKCGKYVGTQFFDAEFYLKNNHDVSVHPKLASASKDERAFGAFHHFINWGWKELRQPSSIFDCIRYLQAYPDVHAFRWGPFAHYIHNGRREGRSIFKISSFKNGYRKRSEYFGEAYIQISASIKFVIYRFILWSEMYKSSFTSSEMAALKKFNVKKAGEIRLFSYECISFRQHESDKDNYIKPFLRGPITFFKLYYAIALSTLGLHQLSVNRLRRLTSTNQAGRYASYILADLSIYHTKWNIELQTYIDTNFISPTNIQERKRRLINILSLNEVICILSDVLSQTPKLRTARLLLVVAHKLNANESSARSALYEYIRTNGLNFSTTSLWYALQASSTSSENLALMNLLDLTNFKYLTHMALVTHLKHRLENEKNKSHSFLIEYNIISRGCIENVRKRVNFYDASAKLIDNAVIYPPVGLISDASGKIDEDAAHVSPSHLHLMIGETYFSNENSALIARGHQTELKLKRGVTIGFSNNYYHWLIEDIPRLKYLSDFQDKDDPLLISWNAQAWQMRILELAGVSERQVVKIDMARWTTIERLIVLPRRSRNMIVHPEDVDFLRSTIMNKIPQEHQGFAKKIYLNRSGANMQRSLINEAEIEAFLASEGFLSIDPSRLSFDQQVNMFRNAEVIVACGGAALSNIAFMTEGSKVIVLAPDEILGNTWACMASYINLDYIFCAGESYYQSAPHYNGNQFVFNFYVYKSDIIRAIS